MRQKDFVLLFGSTCIVVLAWIGVTVYNKFMSSTINEATMVSVKPITDSFDVATLDKVKGRLQIVPVYSVTTNISPSPSPQVTRPTVTTTPGTSTIPTASASGGVQI